MEPPGDGKETARGDRDDGDSAASPHAPRVSTISASIVARGPQLMRGYWRRPEATAEVLKDGWLHTGDVGMLDAEGFLYIQDRLKDVVVTGGLKVYPQMVEQTLLTHPAVAEVAVIGVPDERWGERIEAHVVLKQPGVTAEELDAWCRGAGGLANFKAPKAFHFVLQLPTGPTGKLYRRARRGDA